VRGNLSSLSAVHDAQIEKGGRGQRKNDGKPYLQGCDAGDKPLDPGHCWSTTGLNDGQLAPKNLKNFSELGVFRPCLPSPWHPMRGAEACHGVDVIRPRAVTTTH